MSIRLVTLLVAPLILALTGCPTKPDPLACQEACSHQEVKTFCDIDGVYEDSSLANECIAPPSADACNRIETCTTAGKPYCTDESMGECVQCLTSDQCADGEVCDSGSHECIVLACTPGSDGDASCVAADESLPFCGPAESCVACLVSGDCTAAASAVCDPNDFECRGCIANAECESKLCGEDTGVCASEADIVYVAKTGGADGASCGTLANPCATIGGAQGGLSKVTGSRDTVVVGAGDYPEQIVIDGQTVTLVGDGVVNINPVLGADETGVLVEGNSSVSFTNVKISLDGGSTSSVALKCNSAGGTPSLVFSQGTVSGSGGLGVSATSCNLSIVGSTISGNAGGGILVDNSDYSIVNNFIVGNGNGAGTVGGLRVSGTTANSEKLEFNTFARNVRGGVLGYAVVCDVTGLIGNSNIFMLAEASSAGLTTGDCSHTFSLFDANDSTAPTGNNISDEAVFVDADNRDFHLQAGSPGIDAADPAATLDTDIDGDLRPQGSARDMGADEAG